MRNLLSAFIGASLSLGMLLMAGGCNNNPPTSAGSPAANPTAPPGATASPKGTTAAGTGGKLVIAWAEWDPAKQLETLTKDFTKETGIEVEVHQIPWSSFETEIKKTWTAQDPSYDLIVGDSQWLGKAATAEHYADLTDWMKTNIPVKDIAPAALKYYGEYPEGSGKYYGIPCESDGIIFAYRKDLFEDAKNKEAFKAKYKRDLAPPKTWAEFRDVAEFFTQPDKGLYGAALFYSKEYDGATMGFDQILWSFGGKLSDGKKVQGVLNSPEAVKALEFYTSLKKFTPPGSESYYFAECLRDFQSGKVAMTENWTAFMPDLVDKTKNKFADKTGYFVAPAGPAGHFVSLGGQGISLSSYSKNQDNAKKFLAWFSKEDTQKKWAQLGGLTANQKVAATDDFKKARPYNVVFAETVPLMKDFYNTPNYSELLTPMQKDLNEVYAGTKQPKEALDEIAAEHQKIMDAAK